jgi:hypothetical protein
MSKIRHSHRKYDMRKWCGTKHGLNRAELWPARHITLASRPCVGAFPRTILSTCPEEAVLKVSNAQRQCKEESWPPSQVAWPAGLKIGPHAPNLRPEHRLTPPKNTTVLPLGKGVKKVRFSPPPQGASKFNLCRVEREARFWGPEDSQLVGSPKSSSSMVALPKSIWVWSSYLSSSSVECGSSAGILWIPIDSRLSSPSGVSVSQLVRIPTTLPKSGWFANYSKSFIHFSYVNCAFTYHIVELVFVLWYIRSRVWGSIEYSGTRCGNYYLIPRWLTALIWQKIQDSAVDEVSEALSMHVVPPAIRIVVVPAGVAVLLGLCNTPRSWTGTVGPSLPSLTIAPCEDSLLCYRLIRQPKSILQDSLNI